MDTFINRLLLNNQDINTVGTLEKAWLFIFIFSRQNLFNILYLLTVRRYPLYRSCSLVLKKNVWVKTPITPHLAENWDHIVDFYDHMRVCFQLYWQFIFTKWSRGAVNSLSRSKNKNWNWVVNYQTVHKFKPTAIKNSISPKFTHLKDYLACLNSILEQWVSLLIDLIVNLD